MTNFTNPTEISSNEAAFAQAKKLIPGGVNSPVRAYSSVGLSPRFIASGRGAYITDIEGCEYLDFVQSYGPLILGHANERITKAICAAAERGSSYGAPTLAESALAGAVLAHYPLEQIRFVNSGTEATMSAIRLARGASGRPGLLKFDGCYHGHADALLINAGSGCSTHGAPSSAGVPESATACTFSAVYNDLSSVREAFSAAERAGTPIGAVIIEPIAGNMGFVPAEREFLASLLDFSHEQGALVIFDEVMSGFRAALGGAAEVYGLQPDLATFGKVIGGGLPVGAYAASAQIAAHLSPLGGVYQAGTLSGNPLAMAAGCAALEQLSAELYAQLGALSKALCDGMQEAANRAGIAFCAQAIGSMFGFFFLPQLPRNYSEVRRADTEQFARFFRAMLARGINLAPSLFETSFVCSAMGEAEVQKFLAAFSEAIREADA